MSNELNVFLYNNHIGKIIIDNNGIFSFKYNKGCSQNNSLSISLPYIENHIYTELANSFFDNILPEENSRIKICKRIGIKKNDIFTFLKKFGKECAGALIVSEEDCIPYDDDQYYDAKFKIKEFMSFDYNLRHDNSILLYTNAKLSVAGAQDKLCLRYADNNLFLPLNYAPTTHILKFNTQKFLDISKNEHLCLNLAKMSGINVVNSVIIEITNEPVILLERFDRKIVDGKIMRIHQEDFCQIMGLYPEEKYQETHAYDGFEDIAKIIKDNDIIAIDGCNAVESVYKSAVFNYIIGNFDAHAKNFSVLHEHTNDGRICYYLAPLYDLVSCEVYSENDVGREFAMSIGMHYIKNKISYDDFLILGDCMEMNRSTCEEIIENIADTCSSTIDSLVEEHKDSYGDSDIYDEIADVVHRNTEKLLLSESPSP